MWYVTLSHVTPAVLDLEIKALSHMLHSSVILLEMTGGRLKQFYHV